MIRFLYYVFPDLFRQNCNREQLLFIAGPKTISQMRKTALMRHLTRVVAKEKIMEGHVIQGGGAWCGGPEETRSYVPFETEEKKVLERLRLHHMTKQILTQTATVGHVTKREVTRLSACVKPPTGYKDG